MTKSEQWQLIQSKDPVLAKLLVKVKETFGRPAEFSVKFKEVSNETVRASER